MPKITISQFIYRRLFEHTLPETIIDQTGTEFHENGTVTFPIDDEVEQRMRAISLDPNEALKIMLNAALDRDKPDDTTGAKA